ncbi:hypothetical protein, partial [Streptomyces kronopolitis]|uniref:hypothetical protein n=1 Tax=Streptomyces kronopolitis TaxID=1612435 RepID=UPI00379C6443
NHCGAADNNAENRSSAANRPAAGATAKDTHGGKADNAEISPAQRKDNDGRTAKRAIKGEKPPRRKSQKRGKKTKRPASP